MGWYRKKPIVVEAMCVPPKWDGEGIPNHIARLAVWLGAGGPWQLEEDGGILIRTLEGTMRADIGDWIIRGVKGEIYPCKPDIFEATYEPFTLKPSPLSASVPEKNARTSGT